MVLLRAIEPSERENVDGRDRAYATPHDAHFIYFQPRVMAARVAGAGGGSTIGQFGPSAKPPPGSLSMTQGGRESEIVCVDAARAPHLLQRRSRAMSRAKARSPQRRSAVSKRIRAQ
jgi:hypothetical protein